VVCFLALGVDFWMRLSIKGSGKSEYCGHIPPYVRLCYRTLPWESCVRRYRDHDHWHNLRPDVLAAYQVGQQRIRFRLEWDRATMGTRDLVAKLRTYAQYVASREWFKQEASLPLLLVVTPNSGQERRLARVATATLTDRCGLIIRTTTLTRLHEQGLLGPIWDQVLPHGEGTDLMPRHTLYR
jgi:Replication-relaxation